MTGSGHRHARDGWINTECPFCTGENEGYHLGWNLEGEYFYCWRGGSHPPVKTLSALLNTPLKETYDIINRYGVIRSYIKQLPKNKKEFIIPTVDKLNNKHKHYLKERGFNPDKLEKIWGLKSTGPLSYLHDDEKDYDYRYRIFIPIYWNGEMVSFDTRVPYDKLRKGESKYKACPPIREIRERKHILYGNQEAWDTTGIIVEGPTDVWRLGEYACATCGTAYTQDQIREISRLFKKVAIIFDGELNAYKQGKKLVKELQFRNVDAYQLVIDGDPGSMNKSDAKKLVKRVLNKK